MSPVTSLSPTYVQEQSDPFLSLFPHRYDYIWAEHSPAQPGEKLAWHTESRHPLSDRLIQQGAFLYGVRFAAETRYCLLDIDRDSRYHPLHDPFAVPRMVAALELVGLVSYVACTSSYSGGLHLYFPFEQAQKTWDVAVALETLLHNAGFQVALGQLELFPNVKPYVVSGKPTLYAAHRLPLQAGSYLLNADWEQIYSSPQVFVQHWQRAACRNEINAERLKQVLQIARRRQYCLSGKADKFLNDLNAEIEMGWTGYGQTNFLLGRIAMRSYVFGHILNPPHYLEGKALVDDIVKVATSLPGYQQWCRHQHEIEKRAEEWARCVEASHYFHYGATKLHGSRSNAETADLQVLMLQERPTWNQQQREAARERIRRAIADLLNRGILPATATARFHALRKYGIGGGSLYRHRDLWHPTQLDAQEQISGTCTLEHATETISKDSCCDLQPVDSADAFGVRGINSTEDISAHQSGENLPVTQTHLRASRVEGIGDASTLEVSPSLLEWVGGDALQQAGCKDFPESQGRSHGGNFSTAGYAVFPKQDSVAHDVLSSTSRPLECLPLAPGCSAPDCSHLAQNKSHPGWIRQILTWLKQQRAGERRMHQACGHGPSPETASLPSWKGGSQAFPLPATRSLAEQRQQRHYELMERYLNSNDPILMAEALRWKQQLTQLTTQLTNCED